MAPAVSRAATEEQILELAADAGVKGICVAWARQLPDAYAIAVPFPSAKDRWIIICEARWFLEPDLRASTVAHELAHFTAPSDPGHGRAWRRDYRRLLRRAEEIDWT